MEKVHHPPPFDVANVLKFSGYRADEIYVETMKDKLSAQNLLEEIETAKLHHPTSRQSTSFVSRADALIIRLTLRGNPASSSSTFPLPEHALFSDQKNFNESLAQLLSSEIKSTTDLASKVDIIAKSYRSGYEAVKRVETLTAAAGNLANTLTSVINRVNQGVTAGDDDGSPPNLMNETCLEPSRHSAFLALLPSILVEGDQTTEKAKQVLRSSHPAILGLDLPGIDDTFKADAVSEFQRLTSLRDQARSVSTDVKARVARLRETRRVWTVMGRELKHLEDMRRRLGEAMEQQRWKRDAESYDKLLTPESPSPSPLPPITSSMDISKELDQLATQMVRDIDTPLASLSATLEPPLNDWLSQSSIGLKALLETVTKMAHLLKSIQQQATVMNSVREEYNDLQARIEDLLMRIKSRIDQVLAGQLLNGELMEADVDIKSDIKAIYDGVQTFVDGLAGRIPFVDRSSPSSVGTTFIKRPFSFVNLKLGTSGPQMPIELPFDVSFLDEAVRADSNAYSIKLNGRLESLTHSAAHLYLARIAKEVDSMLSGTVTDINSVSQELSTLEESFKGIISATNVSQPLDSLLKRLMETTSVHRTRIARSFSPIHQLLQTMETSPGVHDSSVREVIYAARCRAVDDAEIRYQTWDTNVTSFEGEILHAQRMEARRLEQLHVAEEERLRAEAERLATEERERLRLEQERLEAEEKLCMEEEQRQEQLRQEQLRIAEEERLRADAERLAAVERERLGLEQERLEAEERVHLEEERRKEELRLEAEQVKVAQEETERVRLERERSKAEERRRIEEDRAAEEHRLEEERHRAAAEEAEKTHSHQERLAVEEKLRAVEARLEQERRLQAEKNEVAAEEAKRRRLEEDEQEHLRLKEARDTEHRRLNDEKMRFAEEAEKQRLEKEQQGSEPRRRKPKDSLSIDRTKINGSSQGISNGGSVDTEGKMGITYTSSDVS
jgi:hypothetical protein